jgi:hypothetical protein
MNTIKLTQQIEAPLSYVFYLFNNKSGWMEWFAQKAYGYAKKKSMLRIYFEPEGNFAFFFTAEAPEEHIAFDFMDLDTKHISQVEVSFEAEDDLVTVSLEHREIPDDRKDFFKRIWDDSLDNLKSMAETGKDLRLWNRPFLGVNVQDWVTPEIAEEQNLPVDFGMQLNSIISGWGAEKASLAEGDIIVNLAGSEIRSYKVFLDLIGTFKAGDTVDLSYYRGDELNEGEITLSAYPVSEPPATAHDYADKIAKFHTNVLKKLNTLLEDSNAAQVEFRPGPGEKSAKDMIGDMIAFESDAHAWISTLVAGCEEYLCPSSHKIRIKGLLSLYPEVDDLVDALVRRQRETVAILRELPGEFVNRRGSFARLAAGLNFDYSKYYKHRLQEIKENLEKAENVRVS